MTTGVASACPQCGAPLRFGGAESLAAACAHCRAAVVRSGARLELAGKVPDLVAIDSRLSLGAVGSLSGEPFAVLGRLQLSRGDATWNEWYASFPRGHGWVAEAQGRLYATRHLPGSGPLPPLSALRAGGEVDLPGAGTVTVDEIGEARLASFEGELPFRPEIGATYRYADCSAAGGGFATLDYGTGEADPDLYAGRQLEWSALGLSGGAPAPAAGAEPSRALACPGCGAPVSLKLAESRAVTCPACRSLLDVKGGGLEVVEVLASRTRPHIPLGAKGALRGEKLEVLGWLRRSATVDGTAYPWDELLLHGAGGYRWLSVHQGHWHLLAPIAAGDVQFFAGRAYRSGGRTLRHFQTATARTDEVQGEFYWEVRVGETVQAEDYVAPPMILSVERSGSEVACARGEYLPADELWKGFGLPGAPPAATGVGAAQPNPWKARAGAAWKTTGLALVALLLLTLGFRGCADRGELFALQVPLEPGRVSLSPPFDIPGGPTAVELRASAPIRETWVGLDVALIEEESGESAATGLNLSSFDGGAGAHAEGAMGGLRGGRYQLRVEPVMETGRPPLPVTADVRVVRGAFFWAPFVLALLALVAWPLAATIAIASFEQRRWAESDHPWNQAATSGGEDDE